MSIGAMNIGSAITPGKYAALMDELNAAHGPPPPRDVVEWGSCRNYPSSMFFPAPGESAEPAKRICREYCAVYAECRAWVMAAPASTAGVWGGMSQRDRHDVLWPHRIAARTKREAAKQARTVLDREREHHARLARDRSREAAAARHNAKMEQRRIAKAERAVKRAQAAAQAEAERRRRAETPVPLGRPPRGNVKLRTKMAKGRVTKYVVEIRLRPGHRFETSSWNGWMAAGEAARLRLGDRPDLITELDQVLDQVAQAC